MRKVAILIVALCAGAAFVTIPSTANAETCTGYHKMCLSVCKSEFNNSQKCLGECPGYRAQCMSTGRWMSRKVQDANVERR